MSLAAIAPDVGVEGERVFPPLAGVYPRTKYTGLPTKDETILRTFFAFRVSCGVGQNGDISVHGHIVNHKDTQLNTENKNQASNRHTFRVLGRLYSLILCG